MSSPARFSAAVHEVGHALVAHALGLPVKMLRIGEGGDDWAGRADIGSAVELPLSDQLAICLAGLDAQELAQCEMLEMGGFGDYAMVANILEKFEIEEGQDEQHRDAAYKRARAILQPQLDKLRRIASELAASGELDEARVATLLE